MQEKKENEIIDIEEGQDYAGFGIRLAASIIDSIMFLIIVIGILYLFMGDNALQLAKGEGLIGSYTDNEQTLISIIYNLIPVSITIFLWMKYKGTPGKLLLNIEVVNEKTGEALGFGASLLRYFGYLLSMIPLFFGYIWILIDDQNRAWHDIISGSVVVYKKINYDY